MPEATPAPAAPPPPPLNINVGDRVVYPNQGLCEVVDIKLEEIAGLKTHWVKLKFLDANGNELKVARVPKENLARNGIRRVSSPDDVKKVFEFLKSDSEKASLDWKKRARDNTERLSIGGLIGLAEVVKGLQVLSELRPLPPKEREQYNDARHLFVTELAAAMGTTEADAEDALDIVLFPVGKERPKRSIEEFQGLEEDELGLGDDMLGMDGGDGGGESEEEPEEKSEDEEGGEEEEGAKKKPAKAAAVKKKLDLDSEETVASGAALEAPAPKKRGRPPKAKPEAEAAPATAEPPAPKKRGRPPKAKPPEAAPPAAPKKRGRPPKAK